MSDKIVNLKDKRIERYNKRKEAHLCVWCTSPLEENTKGTLCRSCAEKNKQRSRENREWCLANGICPICKRNKIYPPEKSCLSCKEKANEKSKDEQRKERRREVAQIRIQGRIDKGLCPECGKRPPEKGFKRCNECRKKQRQRRKSGEWGKRESYKWNGQCHCCGSSDMQEGTKLCKRCYAIFCQNLEKGRDVLKQKKIQEQVDKGILLINPPLTYKKRKLKEPKRYK